MKALEGLLKGFAEFRLGYYHEHLDLFEKLATEGQSPKILIVGCADARVDPGILTQTKPGDIFTVRNIGAMVPPALIPPDNQQHGTSAAIEFAVRGLNVEHIVILGHALCGGISRTSTISRPGRRWRRTCATSRSRS
jgi:carbonic anhydrase